MLADSAFAAQHACVDTVTGRHLTPQFPDAKISAAERSTRFYRGDSTEQERNQSPADSSAARQELVKG